LPRRRHSPRRDDNNDKRGGTHKIRELDKKSQKEIGRGQKMEKRKGEKKRKKKVQKKK
jgi:hypothetical protein